MLFFALVSLFILPFIVNKIYKGAFFEFFKNILFWSFFVTCILLGWIGQKPIESPYLVIGQILTFLYFFYFFILAVIIPFLQSYALKITLKNLYKKK